MQKKFSLLLICVLTMCLFALAACGDTTDETTLPEGEQEQAGTEQSEDADAEAEAESEGAVEEKGVLLMATTTSTDDTGLLDYLAPLFQEDTGWTLEWTAVGTGAALQLGMDGEADVLLVHAKAREEQFVADGYGVERFPVMYNDFVIVGPTDGAIAVSSDINAVFQQILDESLHFVSRGDDSGTHTKETSIWEALGLDYESNPNYVSAGAGMGDTLTMADELQAYCLSDRGTWLSRQADFPTMSIICEGDSNLLNQYGVIAVNPEQWPETNIEGANAFIEWICSDEVQALIAEYGVDQYGEPLFFPNAGSDQ